MKYFLIALLLVASVGFAGEKSGETNEKSELERAPGHPDFVNQFATHSPAFITLVT